MKKSITLVIEDHNTPSTDVQAFSKESATIFITAKDMETALILLDRAKGKAEDGAYCPKEKVGQAWSYTKDVTKEEDK